MAAYKRRQSFPGLKIRRKVRALCQAVPQINPGRLGSVRFGKPDGVAPALQAQGVPRENEGIAQGSPGVHDRGGPALFQHPQSVRRQEQIAAGDDGYGQDARQQGRGPVLGLPGKALLGIARVQGDPGRAQIRQPLAQAQVQG